MTKYLLKRLFRGLLSVVAVVAVVMILIYSLMDRQSIFARDNVYIKKQNNDKIAYTYSTWEEYGYLDYVTYSEYLSKALANGEISQETYDNAGYPRSGKLTKDAQKECVDKFREYYESQGYTVMELAPKMLGSSKTKYANGGNARLFAYKDTPLLVRLGKYFTNLISIDNIHYVEDDEELVGERGLTFTLYDPVNTVYNEDGSVASKKLSPCIMGNGTKHKYLLYVDEAFPYIHQNLVTINLGKSYSISKGNDVMRSMTDSQGTYAMREMTYPSGLREESGDDLHTATFIKGSLGTSLVHVDRYVDNYTNVSTMRKGMSRLSFSFIIGLISTFLVYLLGVPLGIWMALRKDKLVDKLGTIYIVFIIAVPSLAYIFMFKTIGGSFGLPTMFDIESGSALMYVLPIVSLALPSIGNIMKWVRRYMIDQMNSDYVKFARSGGLGEAEIFRKHILKNAIIPIVHGIPGSILGSLVGAIITERVYVVPGVGNMLTNAINAYDNGVIVGLTLFYALISVVSIILGDILMSIVDPRISFTSKAR